MNILISKNIFSYFCRLSVLVYISCFPEWISISGPSITLKGTTSNNETFKSVIRNLSIFVSTQRWNFVTGKMFEHFRENLENNKQMDEFTKCKMFSFIIVNSMHFKWTSLVEPSGKSKLSFILAFNRVALRYEQAGRLLILFCSKSSNIIQIDYQSSPS